MSLIGDLAYFGAALVQKAAELGMRDLSVQVGAKLAGDGLKRNCLNLHFVYALMHG